MKIIIEQKIHFPKIEEEDICFLKSCTIFFEQDKSNGLVEIIPQSINLEPEFIEKFFDIIYFYTFSNVTLKRYENSRYKLIIED